MTAGAARTTTSGAGASSLTFQSQQRPRATIGAQVVSKEHPSKVGASLEAVAAGAEAKQRALLHMFPD